MIFRSTLIMNSKKQILVLFLAFAALLLLADTAGAEELDEGLGKQQHGVSPNKSLTYRVYFYISELYSEDRGIIRVRLQPQVLQKIFE